MMQAVTQTFGEADRIIYTLDHHIRDACDAISDQLTIYETSKNVDFRYFNMA